MNNELTPEEIANNPTVTYCTPDHLQGPENKDKLFVPLKYYRKLESQLTTAQARIAELEDGIKNVIDQKEPKDDKWVMGYLRQLLTPPKTEWNHQNPGD